MPRPIRRGAVADLGSPPRLRKIEDAMSETRLPVNNVREFTVYDASKTYGAVP
jgi:hypothetical protein